MPITPFHFGPGAVLKALAPKTISFVSFVAANILIDIEPLYYMVTRQYPLHRFFHTYIGAALIAIGAILLMLILQAVSKKRARPLFDIFFSSSFTATVIGALLGAYSHIVLDSIMHDDIRPLAPFSQNNALHNIVSLHALHWFCIYSGVFGVVLLSLRYFIKNR